MRVNLYKLFALSTIALAAMSIAPSVRAQTATNAADVVTLQEQFRRAFYSNDGNFFQNRRLGRQADFILGFGTNFLNSFPDNEIAGDGRAVDRLYQEALRQQVLSDGIIRTPDRENPYDTSLLLLPASSATLSTVDQIPPAPVPYSPPPAPAPAPEAAPSRPVPALW